MVVEDVVGVDVGGGTVVVVVVVVGGAPVETAMSTELPGGTLVPATGLDETTIPGPYCVDETEVMVPTVNWALPSV